MIYRFLIIIFFGGLAQGELNWQKVEVGEAPSARLVHAMAYDKKDKSLVLFGGRLFKGGRSGETWIWKNNQWKEIRVSGPEALDGHEMAFCEASDEIILFGGNSENGISDKSWTWNGSEWKNQSVSGPSKRWGHMMIGYREKVLLFGGKGENEFLNDTWEWDGNGWKLVSSDGPPSRYGPRMGVYKGKVLLYGGRDHSGNWYRDTWEWDGKSWKQKDTGNNSPGTSAGHYIISDDDENLFLIGGILKGESFSDIWKWNGSEWKKHDEIPFQLDFGASSYDSDQSKMIITGNAGASEKIELWEAEIF